MFQLDPLGDCKPSQLLVLMLSVCPSSESQKSTFTGGKREREEEDKGVIVNFHRRRHEWLYSVVSGAGGWKPAQPARFDENPKGKSGAPAGMREVGRGEGMGEVGPSVAGRSAGKGPFGQKFGVMGGNN